MGERKTRYDQVLEGMAIWGSYYRENIDVFVKEYLNITYLKWYQYAVLCLMNANVIFLWIASRGMGKTFITAIFSCVRCILYPGSKVVLTSGTRGQALQILEKIQTELIPRSPNLKNEIDFKETKFSGQDAKVMFKNGSYIKVVTASDNLFAKAEFAMQLTAQPVMAYTGKSGGNAESSLVINAALEKDIKNSLLTVAPVVEIETSVLGTNKRSAISVSPGIDIACELTNLCYRFYNGAQAVIQMAADVLATELHYSLGEGTSAIEFSADIGDGDCSTKYEEFEMCIRDRHCPV